jgi:hypothetical protein
MTIAAALAVTAMTLSPIQADFATSNEAFVVAESWIALILESEGNWGGAASAHVAEIHDFQRGDRLLGYYCGVSPHGYVLVSRQKELTPVKAYSTTDTLDTASDTGLVDLLKNKMEQALDALSLPANAGGKAVTVLSASAARDECWLAWNALLADNTESDIRIAQDCTCDGMTITGSRGPLLTSNWHQGAPYNRKCPGMPLLSGDCSSAPDEPGVFRCAAGCTAIAGAQVMNYWSWPPRGEGGHDGFSYEDSYDWARMADEYQWDYKTDHRWEDGTGNPLSDAHIDAVAELVREIGACVGMDYCVDGGCESGAPTTSDWWGKDLLDAFEDHFRYSDEADDLKRSGESAVGWFNLIKNQLNLNRPLPYCYERHAFVCDGWRECSAGGSVVCRQYHMNMGWADLPVWCEPGYDDPVAYLVCCPGWAEFAQTNTWYTLDEIPCSPDEKLLTRIYPELAVGDTIVGKHTSLVNGYMYFDRNCRAVVHPISQEDVSICGYNCQFLPRVSLTAHSADMTFYSTVVWDTRLFSIKGTSRAGIRINEALTNGIKFSQGGGIRFH